MRTTRRPTNATKWHPKLEDIIPFEMSCTIIHWCKLLNNLFDLSTASIFCSRTNLIFVYIYIHTHITSHNYHKHHTNHWKTDGVLSVLRRAWDFLNLSSSDCNCRVAMQHCARMCFELKLGVSFSFPPLNVEPPMLPRTCQGCPMRPIILSSYYHWLVKIVSISVYMQTSWKFSATL